jgi:hypothetical protein
MASMEDETMFKVLDKMSALVEESYNKAQQLDRDLKAKQVELNLTRANGNEIINRLKGGGERLISIVREGCILGCRRSRRRAPYRLFTMPDPPR